jgi:hypothetical protein
MRQHFLGKEQRPGTEETDEESDQVVSHPAFASTPSLGLRPALELGRTDLNLGAIPLEPFYAGARGNL